MRLTQDGFEIANTPLQGGDERSRFMFVRRGDDQILGPIVVPDAVDVMHIFAPLQFSSDDAFHHDSVFVTSPTLTDIDEDVALFVGQPSAFPAMRISARGECVVEPIATRDTCAHQPVEHGMFRNADALRDLRRGQAALIERDDLFCRDEVGHVIANGPTNNAGAFESAQNKCLGGVESFSDLIRPQSAFVQGDDIRRRNVSSVVRTGSMHIPIITEIR